MFLLLMTFLSSLALASNCRETLSYSEILDRSVTNSIELNLKSSEIEIVEGYIQDAEKIYNPELEHFTTNGNQSGDNNITSETRLWFNFQLGNKRQRKGDVFEVQKEMTKTQLEFMRLVLKKEIFLGFLRSKQILFSYERISTIKDLIESLINRYKKIKYLTPEQIVEKNSLEISVTNLDLQRTELRNELELINRFFQRMIRSECEVELMVKNHKAHNKWPDLKLKPYQGRNALELKLADLALNKSQYELKREEAMVWPDLKIGPMWQLNKLGNYEYSLFGIGLTFPIPSFNLNKGMKQVSSASILRNEKNLNYLIEQKRKEFEFRVKRYMDIQAELKDFTRLNYFSDILVETRSLFKRGLISIPIFLSYKNELLEVITRSQSLESAMAQHLMEIYILNNEPLEPMGTNYLAI